MRPAVAVAVPDNMRLILYNVNPHKKAPLFRAGLVGFYAGRLCGNGGNPLPVGGLHIQELPAPLLPQIDVVGVGFM